MSEVFLSYKRERRPAAEHLAQILTLYGFKPWFDRELVKGRDFGQQIDAKIRGSKAVVVLWCKRSVSSRWVLEEADLATELGTVLPAKIEPCELPVGNRRLDCIDLTNWDGAPRSTMLDELLLAIGQLTGTPPHSDFVALRDYEAQWRRFGALPLSAFALAAYSEIDSLPEGRNSHSAADRRELNVLHDIWLELRSSDNLERLRRFLEQVRGTPLDIAVEERIEQMEKASTSTPTARWLREARPLLERVKEVYEGTGWSQAGPAPDPARFEASLSHLIASLPPLASGIDVVNVATVLDDYLKTTLHHGVPIPDDYEITSVFPLPGSTWGSARQRVKLCVRPGLQSSKYHREGYGDLPEGLVVAPEIIFQNNT